MNFNLKDNFSFTFSSIKNKYIEKNLNSLNDFDLEINSIKIFPERKRIKYTPFKIVNDDETIIRNISQKKSKDI